MRPDISVEYGTPECFTHEEFLKYDISQLLDCYKRNKPETFESDGLKNALKLFNEASVRVPAYKDFLRKNNVDPSSIKTLEDFKRIPIMDKKNYLNAYPFKELLWDGDITGLQILSSSSGSTGEPFLWPRSAAQEIEGAYQFETMFKDLYSVDKKRVLFIDCFAMGTWIAGPFVLAGIEYLSKKGYRVMTITPGIDKNVTFGLFKKLANEFDQIIFGGYPPLIKDVIDLGESEGIDWKRYNIKFYFAAEGFSEKWREYIHSKVGATDIYRTSFNMYGSADAANLGHETPICIAIRRQIQSNSGKLKKLFGSNRLPTLVQYDPRTKYFEENSGNLIFTSRAGIPLIRYSIGDQGGVISYDHMKEFFGKSTNSFSDISKECNFNWNLPFVYIFGRSDLTISFYGLLIYPEHIKFGVERAKVNKFITGKFVMSSENYENQDQYLRIRVELANDISLSEDLEFILKDKLQKSITKGLKTLNSEYARLHQSLNGNSLPLIELIKNGDSTFFKSGIKQKWIQK